jgi:thiamine biosynthesis lipoprotein
MPPTSEIALAGTARLHRVEQVMGMPIVIEVCDEEADERGIERAFDWLREVDVRFSTHRPESEVSRIRDGALTVARASADVREVLEECERLREETAGYFDAYASGRLDPSGLVKGWALERAAAVLEDAGARRYAINGGGDVLVRGAAPQGGRWQIGIQHPLERDAVAAVVALEVGAVATSGTYARGEHVLDPHSGLPSRGLLAASAIGPALALADVYATAALAMGHDAPRWCAGVAGHEFLLITEEREVLTTTGFERYRVA